MDHDPVGLFFTCIGKDGSRCSSIREAFNESGLFSGFHKGTVRVSFDNGVPGLFLILEFPETKVGLVSLGLHFPDGA